MPNASAYSGVAPLVFPCFKFFVQCPDFSNAPQGDISTPRPLSPPRPPLVVRIGVVGHRPNRLEGKADLARLATVIRSLLAAIKEEVQSIHEATRTFYADAPPVVRAISPLAEGTDRIFAEQALETGFELCCVMPFSQAEFEKDFMVGKGLEPNSLNRFRALRDRAKTRYELDGSRSNEAGAYGAGGQVLLNQSDLLLVVWDGERRGKRGGTEETFEAARRRGLPVLWIDAQAPHPWQLLDAATPLPQAAEGQRLTPASPGSLDNLRKCVSDAIEIPKPAGGPSSGSQGGPPRKAEDPRQGLQLFYEEHQPADSAPFENDAAKDWPREQTSPVGRLVDYLRPFYAWPDELARIYAERYRSAFVLAFLLAAFAVAMALLPPDWAEKTRNILEIGAIVIILFLVLWGRHRRWHQRWLEYRLAAELVRHLRLVAPLGGTRPFPQIPAHWATYGEPGGTWMAWYVRAVERALGLPTAVVDKTHLQACLAHLTDLLNTQVKYHKSNARRCNSIDESLHFSGIALLGFTLVCCGLHLLHLFWKHPELPPWFLALLPFFCGFSPALGAALAGINNQGEFLRIAKRSEAMREQLTLILEKINTLRGELDAAPSPLPKQFSPLAAALSADAARLLINEVLDWRVVFLDRPLIPPA